MTGLMSKTVPYLVAFAGSLVLTLVLTPLVRELHRRLGMVDRPDPRRINKVPIPRGGGLAIVLGVGVSYSLFVLFGGHVALQAEGMTTETFWRFLLLGFAIALVGLADDRWNLPPKVKLLGQVVIAALVWGWLGLGFRRLWPELPGWIDVALTVFWVTGAMNAFNLIDGLDGLASGLALIATVGMGGTLFLVGNPQGALFYFAFAGGLLGFLRYNYHPASVFLGDCGSMYLGYTLSVLPLVSQTPNSFLVSVGGPLLAMGVPIFDTSLAILRRSLRRLIWRRDEREEGSDQVMSADKDHLHHRILRSAGLNQRKAAWILYALAAFLVGTGLVGLALKSRAAGLWLFAFAAAAVVIFKDMARIELFDAGRLLNSVAHDSEAGIRRRLAVPFYVTFDLAAMVGAFFLCAYAAHLEFSRTMFRVELPIRIVAMFGCLLFFKTYRTVWARAMISNFARLFLACCFGSVIGSVAVCYAPMIVPTQLKTMTLGFALTSFVLLVSVRLVRSVVRDLFYALDCARLKARKDVSRILVYGAGLRYRTFRRELVRTTSANHRMIVGILDDDRLLRGHFIGGIQVLGTLDEAPEVINRVNADAVVIACVVPDERLAEIRRVLAPTGVKLTVFSFGEREI